MLASRRAGGVSAIRSAAHAGTAVVLSAVALVPMTTVTTLMTWTPAHAQDQRAAGGVSNTSCVGGFTTFNCVTRWGPASDPMSGWSQGLSTRRKRRALWRATASGSSAAARSSNATVTASDAFATPRPVVNSASARIEPRFVIPGRANGCGPKWAADDRLREEIPGSRPAAAPRNVIPLSWCFAAVLRAATGRRLSAPGLSDRPTSRCLADAAPALPRLSAGPAPGDTWR